MAWEGMNRRRFPRANYACVVTIRRKGHAEAFNTKTENIGSGGICVMLPKETGIFNPVEIELDIKDTQTMISCNGTIVWVVHRSEFGKEASDSYDTGIEFSDLKEKDQLRIDKIIKKCLQKNKS